MRLSRRNRNTHRGRDAGDVVSVRNEQTVPTKPTKAYVAAIVTIAGLVGIHITSGTAQAIVMVGQLLLVVYGVWRARNLPKRRGAVNHDPGDFL